MRAPLGRRFRFLDSSVTLCYLPATQGDIVVFFNYSTMQMAAKIVYYGPGLCGKTTNLQIIYTKTAPNSRGEMVCLETETDRTLFFDLLPMDVGVIGGFRTRFQLYTVPGQVFYNSTRKLVLRGVDGIVFVADSQIPMEDANVESLQNLRENLLEHNIDIETIPLVFQFNKRDLTNVMPVEKMNRLLNPVGLPHHEAAAVQGIGVFETLKGISKATLFSLRRKALGDEKVQKPSTVAVPTLHPKQPEPPGEEKTLPGDRVTPRPAPSHRAPTPTATLFPIPLKSLEVAPKVEAPALDKALVEEKVEFAVRSVQAASLDQEKIAMKTIAINSTIDIGQQLDALRERFTQTKTPSEKAHTKTYDDKKLEDLLQSAKPSAAQELKRKTSISIPSAMVKAGPTTLVLTIQNTSSQKSESVEIPLEIDKSSGKIFLKIDLDITIVQ